MMDRFGTSKAQARYDAQQPPDRPAPEYRERDLWAWVRDQLDGELASEVEEKIAQGTGWTEESIPGGNLGAHLTNVMLDNPKSAPDWLRPALFKVIDALCEEWRERYEEHLQRQLEEGSR